MAKSRLKIEDWFLVDAVLINALEEDLGSGDVTTSSLIFENHLSDAVLIAKGELVVAGLPFAERVFQLVDSSVKFKSLKKDGSRANAGNIIARIKGKTERLLIAERTALNILQRVSGIATFTDRYVKAVKGLKVKIADTRKTAPGLRLFDKYAVRAGGGINHRFGLFDGVLIKDNHIAAAGSLGNAVKRARLKAHHLLKVEVEVKNIPEIKKALRAGADAIMLDNMPADKIKKAVSIIRSNNSNVIIEASGNINQGNVRKIAETGVDLISIGALTHSAPAADVSMKVMSL
jgi:nicotinate-nucleotide pyrophosphorylase (carboxylating)